MNTFGLFSSTSFYECFILALKTITVANLRKFKAKIIVDKINEEKVRRKKSVRKRC